MAPRNSTQRMSLHDERHTLNNLRPSKSALARCRLREQHNCCKHIARRRLCQQLRQAGDRSIAVDYGNRIVRFGAFANDVVVVVVVVEKQMQRRRRRCVAAVRGSVPWVRGEAHTHFSIVFDDNRWHSAVARTCVRSMRCAHTVLHTLDALCWICEIWRDCDREY